MEYIFKHQKGIDTEIWMTEVLKKITMPNFVEYHWVNLALTFIPYPIQLQLCPRKKKA